MPYGGQKVFQESFNIMPNKLIEQMIPTLDGGCQAFDRSMYWVQLSEIVENEEKKKKKKFMFV